MPRCAIAPTGPKTQGEAVAGLTQYSDEGRVLVTGQAVQVGNAQSLQDAGDLLGPDPRQVGCGQLLHLRGSLLWPLALGEHLELALLRWHLLDLRREVVRRLGVEVLVEHDARGVILPQGTRENIQENLGAEAPSPS